MKLRKCKVLCNEILGPGVCCLWVEMPQVAASAWPGEFVMIPCVGADNQYDPLLARAISIHRYGPKIMASEPDVPHPEWVTPTSIALLFNASGLARSWLGARKTGDEIYVLGPLGRGYEIDSNAKHLLLAGGGTGLAPHVALADEALATGRSVTIISAGRTASLLYPRERIQSKVRHIEVTEDGSVGEKGLITDCLPKYVDEADQVFLCGPVPMYRAVLDTYSRMGIDKPTQVLSEVRMACGFGICYGCAIPTRTGMKMVCTDGPKFELEEVFWEKLG